MAKLDIVIVNWNSGGDLQRCLESVAAASEGVDLGRVVVVDNGSTDGSCDELEQPGLPLELLRNKDNAGFGRACNQGAGEDPSEYLLFLNPDTELAPGSLATAVQYLERDLDGRIGVLGIQLVDAARNVIPSCSRFPTPGRLFWQSTGLSSLYPRVFQGMRMPEWSHDSTTRVDQVIGACFFVRRETFQALEGFDLRFFVYFEEVDFCLRTTLAGQDVIYLVDAQVMHVGGGSSGSVPAARLFYSWRSRIQFARKHLGLLGTLAVLASTLVVEFPLRLLVGCGKLSGARIRNVLWAFGKLSTHLPGLLRQR